jgi:adenylate kinase
MTSDPLFVVLLGPPASGKGTQAARLRDALGLPHVASGDLFRDHLRRSTPLGAKAKTYMDRGDLVPDDITIGMVMDRLARRDALRGAILDGFPRTIPQAEALDRALQERGQSLAVVLSIEVPDEVLVERVSGRRLCRTCTSAYHIRHNPPAQEGICDKDGGELYQRSDDRSEVVRERLRIYWQKTSPLVQFYARRGLLETIDGDQPIDAVTDALCSAIERHRPDV